jgi:hypothetical protein
MIQDNGAPEVSAHRALRVCGQAGGLRRLVPTNVIPPAVKLSTAS